MLTELPVSLLAKIGRCGEAAVILLLRCAVFALRAGYRLFRELVRLLAALLMLGIEQLRGFATGEAESAKEIRAMYRKQSPEGSRVSLWLHIIGQLLVGKRGVIRTLLR